jgi:hypothetical protein
MGQTILKNKRKKFILIPLDIDSNIEDSHSTDIRTFTEGSKITLDSTESSNDSRKSLPKSIEDRPPSLYPPRPIQPSQNKKRYGIYKKTVVSVFNRFTEINMDS